MLDHLCSATAAHDGPYQSSHAIGQEACKCSFRTTEDKQSCNRQRMECAAGLNSLLLCDFIFRRPPSFEFLLVDNAFQRLQSFFRHANSIVYLTVAHAFERYFIAARNLRRNGELIELETILQPLPQLTLFTTPNLIVSCKTLRCRQTRESQWISRRPDSVGLPIVKCVSLFRP